MKKKDNKTILIIAIVAVLAIVFLYSSGTGVSTSGEKTSVTDKVSNFFQGLTSGDRGGNGYWNSDTQECWTTQSSLNGKTKDSQLVSCCFDQSGYQVDCKDATKRLSDSQVVFAIYQPQGTTATPGIFSVAHTITISNTGAVDLEKVWIDSASWTSSPSNTAGNTALNGNYSRIVGPSTTYAGAIAVGGAARSFPTTVFKLQDLDTGAGTNYTLTLNAKATAGNGNLNSTIPLAKWMYIKKESIGFSVDIVWQ